MFYSFVYPVTPKPSIWVPDSSVVFGTRPCIHELLQASRNHWPRISTFSRAASQYISILDIRVGQMNESKKKIEEGRCKNEVAIIFVSFLFFMSLGAWSSVVILINIINRYEKVQYHVLKRLKILEPNLEN